MASLKRKTKKESPEQYKPSLYPTFSIYSSDGIELDLDEKGIGKLYNAKVKFVGINKRTKSGKNDVDWTFEIQTLGV